MTPPPPPPPVTGPPLLYWSASLAADHNRRVGNDPHHGLIAPSVEAFTHWDGDREQWLRGPDDLPADAVPLQPGREPAPAPSVSVAAVVALAQGEPVRDVVHDYGVRSDVLRDLLPAVGRSEHPGPRPLLSWQERRFEDLAELGPGWDDYDATPPAIAALVLARQVAVSLAQEPSIRPTRDGGVQLEWRAGGELCEIVVEESGRVLVAIDDQDPPVDRHLGATSPGVLWMAARYAYRRATYAVQEVCSAITGAARHLPARERERMAAEIEREALPGAWECDARSWRHAVAALRAGEDR